MPETFMCYVAADPKQPGAAFAGCIDMPGFEKQTAKDIASWKRRGGTIKHVDTATLSDMMGRWVPPAAKAVPDDEGASVAGSA